VEDESAKGRRPGPGHAIAYVALSSLLGLLYIQAITVALAVLAIAGGHWPDIPFTILVPYVGVWKQYWADPVFVAGTLASGCVCLRLARRGRARRALWLGTALQFVTYLVSALVAVLQVSLAGSSHAPDSWTQAVLGVGWPFVVLVAAFGWPGFTWAAWAPVWWARRERGEPTGRLFISPGRAFREVAGVKPKPARPPPR
jgi:hypothetical protein